MAYELTEKGYEALTSLTKRAAPNADMYITAKEDELRQLLNDVLVEGNLPLEGSYVDRETVRLAKEHGFVRKAGSGFRRRRRRGSKGTVGEEVTFGRGSWFLHSQPKGLSHHPQGRSEAVNAMRRARVREGQEPLPKWLQELRRKGREYKKGIS